MAECGTVFAEQTEARSMHPGEQIASCVRASTLWQISYLDTRTVAPLGSRSAQEIPPGTRPLRTPTQVGPNSSTKSLVSRSSPRQPSSDSSGHADSFGLGRCSRLGLAPAISARSALSVGPRPLGQVRVG